MACRHRRTRSATSPRPVTGGGRWKLDAVHELGGPPVVATPHLPTYPKLVETVCARLDWNLSDFRGYRVVMSYPPIPAVLILRYPLPERPESGS